MKHRSSCVVECSPPHGSGLPHRRRPPLAGRRKGAEPIAPVSIPNDAAQLCWIDFAQALKQHPAIRALDLLNEAAPEPEWGFSGFWNRDHAALSPPDRRIRLCPPPEWYWNPTEKGGQEKRYAALYANRQNKEVRQAITRKL